MGEEHELEIVIVHVVSRLWQGADLPIDAHFAVGNLSVMPGLLERSQFKETERLFVHI